MIIGGEPNYDSLLVGAEPAAHPQGYGPPPQGYYPPQQGGHYGPPGQHIQHHPHHAAHPQHAQHPGYAPQHYAQPQHYAPAMLPAPPQGRHVVTEALTKSRDFPIGFTSYDVPANTVAEIEVKPQVLFKGKRLAVANSIAKAFVIIDIKVGTAAQLAATGDMSAEAFTALAVDTKMEFDTAAPGTTITIRVRNISSQSEHFLAVLYGSVMT